MLDKLPPVVRHLLILLAGATLTWVGEDALPAAGPWLAAHPPLGPLAGALVAQLLLVLFPLTRQYGTGSGRHAADRGSVRPLALALPVALLLGLVLAGPAVALAAHRRAQPPGPLYVGIWAAHDCQGVLQVGYGTERLQGRTWGIVPDSWGADLQLHYVGNGAGEGGRWETVPARWRTEGNVAAVVTGLPTWDLARVVLHAEAGDVVSSGRPVGGCEE